MKKVFITFSEGDEYEELCSVLKESIDSFSEYELIKYSSKDFDLKWTPEKWKPGFVYIFKILSCLKSLEKYDDIVWLDTDIIVTNKIDKIWKFENEIYPILPKYRFDNFINSSYKLDCSNEFFLRGGKERLGIDYKSGFSYYLQACCMKFDKKSKSFFEEVLWYFENEYSDEFFPFGDESIINLLMWKYNFKGNLGNIFLCSYHFDKVHIKKFIDISDGDIQAYQDLFSTSIRPDDEKSLVYFDKNGNVLDISYHSHNRIGLIDCSNEILFLHGSKDFELHKSYLERIILKEKSLSSLMNKHGSDKSTSHNYTEIYHELFHKYINKSINIFEMGIGTNNTNILSNMGENGKPGASLRAWSEYFINANVFAADIDYDILFEEKGISTFWCDQKNKEAIKNMWNNNILKDIEFEIIIDDGLHEFESNMTFLENSIHKIKKGGYFIIEDLMPITLKLFKDKIKEIRLKWPEYTFDIIELDGRPNRIDNNLILIKREK
jgi:hypothetical protein